MEQKTRPLFQERHWFNVDELSPECFFSLVKEAISLSWKTNLDELNTTKSFCREASSLPIPAALEKLKKSQSVIPVFLSNNWFEEGIEGPYQVCARFVDPQCRDLEYFLWINLTEEVAKSLMNKYGIKELI